MFCCYQLMSRGSSLALPAISSSVKQSTIDTQRDFRSGTYLWFLELGQSIPPLEVDYCKASIPVEQCANGKTLPGTVQAPSQFIWDLWERHVVPEARLICRSQEELAALKCHRLSAVCSAESMKSGKFPYIVAFWKSCLDSTSPNAQVGSTLGKYILKIIQMWAGQIMELFPLQVTLIFLSFLSPKYFNLCPLEKKNKKIDRRVSRQLASCFLPWRTWLFRGRAHWRKI